MKKADIQYITDVTPAPRAAARGIADMKHALKRLHQDRATTLRAAARHADDPAQRAAAARLLRQIQADIATTEQRLAEYELQSQSAN